MNANLLTFLSQLTAQQPLPRPGVPAGGVAGGGNYDVRSFVDRNGELHGVQDGAPIRLSTGLIIESRQVANQRVTNPQLMSVMAGIMKLPVADQQLLATHNIRVELIPTYGLENAANGKMMIGSTTTLTDRSGHMTPTTVRIAVDTNRTGSEAIGEVIQHEIGHAVSVLRSQDSSEAAADRYAARY